MENNKHPISLFILSFFFFHSSDYHHHHHYPQSYEFIEQFDIEEVKL